MLGYLTNEYLGEQHGYQREGERLFIQKIKELLHKNSGISYSYKLHNAYSILMELKVVIEDLQHQRTNGFILEEVRKEAEEILKKDIVIKQNLVLYDVILSEIKKGFRLEKNNQSISDSEMINVNKIQMLLANIEKEYSIIEYLGDTLDLLKNAIYENDADKIISLAECVVSSIIATEHSIDSSYKTFTKYFEPKEQSKTFEECWKQWVGSLLLTKAEYWCYFKLSEKSGTKVIENKVEASDIKSLEGISDEIEICDTDLYFKIKLNVPANDKYSLVEKAFDTYRKEMGIIEFATGYIESLEDEILIYDTHFKRMEKVKKSDYPVEVFYKPFNQYHKNIDYVVRDFLNQLDNEVDKNKLINAIVNNCNFEKEGKEYDFLLLWSSLESLFRSSQYSTAISAIKDIVPNILSYRYIYYRLFDFLKDCYNIRLQYTYQGKELIIENPNDEKIEMLYSLISDETISENFLQMCKAKYELLYYRGIELKNILTNVKSIKQKVEHHKIVLGYQLQRMYRSRNRFVHHSIIDKNIVALCKHIRVYMWEAIREMSYVASKRNIKTLEELYSYFRINYSVMQKTLIGQNAPIDIKQIIQGYL